MASSVPVGTRTGEERALRRDLHTVIAAGLLSTGPPSGQDADGLFNCGLMFVRGLGKRRVFGMLF